MHSPVMFSEVNGQRPLPYGALDYESATTTSQAERLLMQENLLLRQSYQQLLHQMDQLVREKDYIYTQLHTFNLLYVQLKHDRNRIARQLTSTQRELEHLKRTQANFHALGHHHLESFRRRQPRYFRSLKGHSTTDNSVASNQHPSNSHHRNSSKKFRRTRSAKYHGGSSSMEQFPVEQSSSYRRFDTLNEYPPQVPGQVHQNDQWSVGANEATPVTPIMTQIINPLVEEQFMYPSQIAPPFEDNSEDDLPRSDAENYDDEDDDTPKRPKLMYRNSLRQCVEFSRSLLDLSKRHIVGAEIDNNDDENENTNNDNNNQQFSDHEDNYLKAVDYCEDVNCDQVVANQLISNGCVMVDQSVSTVSPLMDQIEQQIHQQFLQHFEQQQPEKIIFQAETEQTESVQTENEQTESVQTKTVTQQHQQQTENDNIPVEIARPVTESSIAEQFESNESLVVNLSYLPDCTTYLREVKLKNKPKDFLGIFFESAFTTGVVVQQVVPNSIADRAGIIPGDRVLEICGINMRKANFRLANKIIQECETDFMTFKVVASEEVFSIPMTAVVAIPVGPSDCSTSSSSSSSASMDTTGDGSINVERAKPLRKTCTLTRREAFKNKTKLHSYFERKHSKEAMLYQTCHLSVSLPRRITVNQPLAKIKLLGGNAVGIFVHSIGDKFLSNLLQRGDQLLEYNNFDLTKATAEEAAIELAKPARNGVLVALFNMETYSQIQETSTGDSFYIRTEFSRASINKSLEFKKGDILYVDNTLYNGKPGYWRAWQVDQFGQKVACGVIPSKYNAQNELMKYDRSTSHSKWPRFKLFTIPYRIFFWRTKPAYTKLSDKKEEKSRVLATCSMAYTALDNQDGDSVMTADDEEMTNQLTRSKSYQVVNMIDLKKKPRPVLIFGPFSHVIAERLEAEFPHLYKQCTRQSISTVASGSGQALESSSSFQEQYLHCTHQKDMLECISLAHINDIINGGVHPVISVVTNGLEDFRGHNLFPIVVGLKFRSAKHIKETVNKWKINERRTVYYKMAKTSYNHMLKMEQEFKDSIDVRITGNNLTYMCTQIKDRVREEQNKVVWSEADQL